MSQTKRLENNYVNKNCIRTVSTPPSFLLSYSESPPTLLHDEHHIAGGWSQFEMLTTSNDIGDYPLYDRTTEDDITIDISHGDDITLFTSPHKSSIPDQKSSKEILIDMLIEEERIVLGNSRQKSSWKRRIFLLCPFGMVIVMGIYPEYLFDVKYITPIAFVCSFIIFWNFPQIGAWLQSKPTYVEDLAINVKSVDIRYRFVKRYTLVTNFFLSGLFVVIIDYTFFQQYNTTTNLDTFEMVGIIGGVMSLYFKIQAILGKMLLLLFYRMKKRSVRRLNDNFIKSRGHLETEMTSIK